MQGTKNAPLFDHLVGEREQIVVECNAERFGRLEINYELKFRGLHDRQIGGRGTLENTAGIDANLSVALGEAVAVAHEAACCRKSTFFEDGRQLVARASATSWVASIKEEWRGADH